MKRPIAVQIDNGLGRAAVDIPNGHISSRTVDRSITVEVPLRGRGQTISTYRDSRLICHDPRRLVVDDGFDLAAINTGYIRLYLIDRSVTISIAGGTHRPSVGTCGGYGTVLDRSIGVVVCDRTGRTGVCVDGRYG